MIGVMCEVMGKKRKTMLNILSRGRYKLGDDREIKRLLDDFYSKKYRDILSLKKDAMTEEMDVTAPVVTEVEETTATDEVATATEPVAEVSEVADDVHATPEAPEVAE